MSRHKYFVFVFLGLSWLLTSARPARADWKVCNRAGYDVWITIGWQTRTGNHSAGWWKVAGCGCTRVFTGRPEFSGVFLRAKRADTGELVSRADNFLLCMKPINRFEFVTENSVRGTCERAGGQLADYQLFTLPDGADPITTISPPRKPTDSVCID